MMVVQVKLGSPVFLDLRAKMGLTDRGAHPGKMVPLVILEMMVRQELQAIRDNLDARCVCTYKALLLLFVFGLLCDHCGLEAVAA